MRYLFLDVETGGLDPQTHSLLTAYFLVTEARGSKVGSLELLLRPDGPIIATPEALAVNGIDLEEHARLADSYADGRCQLERFLCDVGTFDELVPVAHNATFDLLFIHWQLIPRGRWEQLVAGRVLDTCVHWRRFHERQGVRVRGRLQDVAEHYGMAGRYAAHTAGGDVLLMRDLFFHIEELRGREQVKAAYP